jgi:hypothetical protein
MEALAFADCVASGAYVATNTS